MASVPATRGPAAGSTAKWRRGGTGATGVTIDYRPPTRAEQAGRSSLMGGAITSVHLPLKAKIPGGDQATFNKLTVLAKAG